MYYLKRYLPAIFIIVLLMFFPVRRFLRQHGYFIFSGRNLKEAVLWAHQDSIRVADSLKRINIESKVPDAKRQDSQVKPGKEENPVLEGDGRDTYYIIAGSFASRENARKTAGKYRSRGYKTSIISMTNQNGIRIELVSVKTFNNVNEAKGYLREFQSRFDPAAWIYSKK